MSVVKLPQLAWYEPGKRSLTLPDSWQVESGYGRPALKPEGIEAAIRNPVGMQRLRDLARGKKEADSQ
jgi:hypothetical protein